MRLKYLLTTLLPLSALLGQDWNAASGDWGVAGNWTPASVPNAIGGAARFPTVGGVPITVTLSTVSPTVGTLTFFSPIPAVTYTIAPASTNILTLHNSSGSALIDINAANAASHTISAPLALASNLLVTQASGANLTIAGIVSGGSGITLSGAGVGRLILSAVNTFTGGLTISGNTLECGIAQAIAAAGSVTLSGGTLDLANNAQTIKELSGSGGTVQLGTAALTLATTTSSSYAGIIAGVGGSLLISGTGSLTLTGANTYNGGTTVNSGSLILGASNALSLTGALTAASPGIFNLNNFSQDVASLAGNGSVTLGSGTLTISGSSSTVFSGVISGTGSFVHNGTATTTFSGANTYTGGTTLSNTGTLQLGASNALPPSSNLTMTNGVLALNNFSQTIGTFSATAGSVTLGTGELTVAPTAAANFSAVISGSGSLVFQGSATWTLLAAQTYTGPTTINGGTLRMGVANGLNLNSAVTINTPGILNLNSNPLEIASLAGAGIVSLDGNTLTLRTTATTSFSGVIEGTGSLLVEGTGTQIFLGPNTYSGGTAITASATLEGTTESLQGAIANNGTLFFNQTFPGVYAGPLIIPGTLKIGGGGVVTLTGTPSQGTVEILSGNLNIPVGSNLTAAVEVNIHSGGTLSGGGTITGPIFNAGTIAPTALLTASGNVEFQPGSFFTADVTRATSDRLAALGNIAIQNGSEVVINVTPGPYQVENHYTIMTAAGGPITGQFQGFELSNPFLNARLFYNQTAPGSVGLELLIRSVSDVIKGGNPGAFAQCLSQTNMKKDADLEHLVAALVFFSVEKVRKILDEMQPSQLRAQTVAEQTNTLFAMQTINMRTAQFDRTECENKINTCHPWNFWVSLAGNWTEQRPADHHIGYFAPAAGFTTGFDGKVADNLYLGCALEYGHTELTWKESQGSSTINRMSTGPYLSYIGRFGHINAALLGSIANFDTTRQIPFFERAATSSHNGETLLSHLDAGFVFHPAPAVSLTPFATLDLLFGWEDAYQEHGAESLNFRIDSSSSTLFRSELGLKIAKCATRAHGKWVHDMKASWVREERFHGQQLTATFRQFPCSFTVDGLYPSRSFLDLAMGLTFIFKKDKYAASLRYDGQFGEAVSIQSGIAQLLTRF